MISMAVESKTKVTKKISKKKIN